MVQMMQFCRAIIFLIQNIYCGLQSIQSDINVLFICAKKALSLLTIKYFEYILKFCEIMRDYMNHENATKTNIFNDLPVGVTEIGQSGAY